MGKAIVVYSSKHGSTEKYAKWIAEALQCKAMNRKEVSATTLAEYDTIIYGGGLYAGMVNGFGFIKNNIDALKDKRLVLFTVGLTNPSVEENQTMINEGLRNQMTAEMRDRIQVFMLRGNIERSKLGFFEKLILNMVKKSAKGKKDSELTSRDRDILALDDNNINFVDRAAISPIVDFVNGMGF